jgi:hypothetical protein
MRRARDLIVWESPGVRGIEIVPAFIRKKISKDDMEVGIRPLTIVSNSLSVLALRFLTYSAGSSDIRESSDPNFS